VAPGGHNGPVDLTADLDAACPPKVVYAAVEDLGTYPQWLEIVARAESVADHPDDDGDAAWLIDLRGRMGPLARSKRLRMVRTQHHPDDRVRFERREHDGRNHSDWVLEAQVEPVEGGSRLTMGLHYGGSFGGSVLERLLGDAIERSRPALLTHLGVTDDEARPEAPGDAARASEPAPGANGPVG
jgi:hypothetical protein